jgi:AraC-like DNA-binding protein
LVTRYPAGHVLPWHDHAWAQLVYAGEGFLTVQLPGARWVVPADRGVWVPPRMPHRLECRTRTLLQTIYVSADVANLPDVPRVVHANALVRELIRHVTTIGTTRTIDMADPADARLILVLIDQLQSLDVAPLELPDPHDARSREATDLIRDDPSRALDDVARHVGTSRRTLERDVHASTGLSLGQWRQRARMLAALEALAAGTPVSRVAVDVGYATPSAFTAAFRTVLGTTPARFFG